MKTAFFILLALAALTALACESAAQQNNFAAAAPTATATPQHMQTPEHTQTPTPSPNTPTTTPTPTDTATPQHTQTPTATPDPLNPPTPQPCPPGEIPVPITVRDGIVYMPDPPCFRLTTPEPLAYPKLAGSLSKVAELYCAESGASAQSAAMAAFLDDELREGSFFLKITIDREPRELVIWLNDNGAEFGYVNGTYMVDEGWPARNNTTIDAEYGIILLSEYIRGEAEPEPNRMKAERAYVGARVPVLLAGSPFGTAGRP